ncbi:hypothetical protein [Sulfuricurvum sp.]|uniref:hypothetical protein n=1 Tax=Sulfuricurvum sp. TaxID=2025608 RepID=UPI003BB7A37D
MNQNQQQTYSTIVSANPYKGDYCNGTFNTISNTTSPSFAKDQYAISSLNTRGFISTLIGISKNIPDDDIYHALENKVYEELALDMAVEYRIRYIEAIHRSTENDRYFHVFVVDPLTLEQEYVKVINTIKYIDQIIPIPLLLKSLYVKELINSSDVHCFIYFQENDAFFCIYHEQEFVYAKSLKFSLLQMHERFVELLGEQIDFTTFSSMLVKEGLNSSNSEYQKNLIKLFGEILLHINDIMAYAKRAYDIKRFDELYIGSSAGIVIGLDEYAQTYLGLRTAPLDFNYGFQNNGSNIDQIHQLMHVYGHLPVEERYECNFTIFERPPPFAKRESGKLILITATALAGALLYPGVYWGLSYIEEFHHAVLSKEYEQVHIEKMTREATVNLKLANKKVAQTLLDEQKTAYKQKQDTLIQVHEKKVDYPMKARIMADFTQSFNNYRVQLQNVNYTENNTSKIFSFGLISSKTQDITALLKHLTETKRNQYNFKLELITYDTNTSSYLSELKAVIK